MTAADSADCLVEIGTEELPPKALKDLRDAFAAELVVRLDELRLGHGEVEAFASPRRLAVKIRDLAVAQQDREIEQKGPPVAVAFDKDGLPTQAARAFADRCGVAVEDLQRLDTGKGEWLLCQTVEQGRSTAELLPESVRQALAALPIPRRMRWGAHSAEFVRPVHWVVLLHGDRVVEGEILGIAADRVTNGHRFMADEPIALAGPDDYPDLLAKNGYVFAEFDARREYIVTGVRAAASDAGGEALGDDALFDEVAALTEWPVPLVGSFDDGFLALPREVIVATLTGHQRYFPVADAAGGLLPVFVTVANLESHDPDKVRDGNERVIRPRLADAAFFWDADRRRSLDTRRDDLANVVYQRGLGNLAERSERLAELAAAFADAGGVDQAAAQRAALLSKCDLLTGMVGEFPELQGTMGGYYARAGGEAEDIAVAIGEQYRPRFAGDGLPDSALGKTLAAADKLDTLCGVFALGRKPSGNRDPFGVRRAALGLVRILTEGGLDADLPSMIARGLALQPCNAADEVAADLYDFVLARMRGLWLERDGVTGDMFDAVCSRQPGSLADADARIEAVRRFSGHPSAESLAAANKRIANILKRANVEEHAGPDVALLGDGAERALFEALRAARKAVAGPLHERRYTEVLTRLAELREPVDRFFDDVMVMDEDAAIRRNRLALLAALRARFLDVADISRLSLGKS